MYEFHDSDADPTYQEPRESSNSSDDAGCDLELTLGAEAEKAR